MKDVKQAINRVISTIDWRKIKSFHTKLGIKWQYEFDKEIIHKVPTVPELKAELTSILYHMATESLDYLSYGNWVIFWEDQDIRVIFRLADFSFEGDHTKETLMEALQRAVEMEDYEYAAVIRDEINSLNSHASRDIK
jgi:hypothetical protein